MANSEKTDIANKNLRQPKDALRKARLEKTDQSIEKIYNSVENVDNDNNDISGNDRDIYRGVKYSSSNKKQITRREFQALADYLLNSGIDYDKSNSIDNKKHNYEKELAAIQAALEPTFLRFEFPNEIKSSFSKNVLAQIIAHQVPRNLDAEENPALPVKAPENYIGLRGSETPPDFIKRVYSPWLGRGLTRAHIRVLDPKLSVAINNWLSRAGNRWPPEVDLPTKAEQTNRLLATGDEAVREHLGKFTGAEAVREAHRLKMAELRRR